MSIQLATAAQVKAMLGATADFPDDTLLTTIIQMVSAAIQAYLGRELEDTGSDTTQYFSGNGSRRVFVLKRFPNVTVTSVHDSIDRAYGSGDLLSSDDYAVYADEGIVELEYPAQDGIRNLRVVYSGGYEAATGVLPVPDAMKNACILQAAETYRRKETMTLIGMSTDLGNISAPVTFDVMDLTPGVKRLLDPFKVMSLGAA